MPPIEKAATHVAAVISTALAAGRAYRVICWACSSPTPDYADTPAGALVSYGAVHTRRDGTLRYQPRGLHDPLTADSSPGSAPNCAPPAGR